MEWMCMSLTAGSVHPKKKGSVWCHCKAPCCRPKGWENTFYSHFQGGSQVSSPQALEADGANLPE